MTERRLYIPSIKTYVLAASKLKQGDIVSFPTETVYGLGADATNSSGVAKIYAAKERPSFNPLIVHLASAEKAQQYVKMNALAQKLADKFWPGPFTMVLPLKENSGLSDLISAGLDTVAVRVPKNDVAHSLLEHFDGPIAAPSANKSGNISPTTAQHVDGEFGEELEMIIDGGPCEKGIESTIVQIEGEQIIILRPGNITISEIEAVTSENVIFNAQSSDTPNSPGQLESHYAPNSKMRLNASEVFSGECFLGFGECGPSTVNLSPSGDLIEAAANLFSMMRKLDQMDFDTIAVAHIPPTGLGMAINDRLKRAAAPRDNK
ncbi:MAG: threonylcarbamoyl-AMP synthase [Kordiimonadaceae bacterium]|jgi:L-threonylcarbamoyladenylate synthase|nr:threonylcarbamoyl-AMP synthase [Kordiimonadaceae bacterium]MBT6036101.1 threonylcarbamoyl-AMP synthase [Kordiimonadaceae bacterium]MBT6328938.1 threonylcarbamoyl-AMP synthase [Kordiimonadaceae bacterium]MBT7582290.1 threonylcarbamoyl-AMP synthase [Kordiimonadaceae bacterium]